MNREVIFYVAPDSFRADTSKYRLCETFDGNSLTVDEVRGLSNYSHILYYFINVDKFSSYVNSALLKIVEEGACNFYFQSKSIIGCNRALVSRCVKVFSQETFEYSSLSEMGKFLGVGEVEFTIVEALLGLRDVNFNYLLKEGIDFSKIFLLLSTAYVNQSVLPGIKRTRWSKIRWIFSQPFKPNKYTLLYLWRYTYG